MALTSSSRLGCGRDVDELWANIGHEPDEHEATCPDCQSARQDLSGLSSATAAMTEADDIDHRLVPRPGALAAIMAIVRAEVRRGATLPLIATSPDHPGELTISEQAVATIVREACDRFADVEGRRCRVSVADEPTPRPSMALPAGPNALDVELSVTVAKAVSIPALARDLRGAVGEIVRRQVGLRVASVAIHVEDVHDV